MYYYIRYVAIAIFLLVMFIIFKKRFLFYQKRTKIGIALVSVLVCLSTFVFPLEYYLVDFDSVKSAIDYVDSNRKIENIIYSEDCAYVHLKNYNDDSLSMTCVEKSGEGWKIPFPLLSLYRGRQFYQDGITAINRLSSPRSRSNLIYIIELVTSEDQPVLNIVNSSMIDFEYYEYDSNDSNPYFIRLHFYVTEEDLNNYQIIIDGNQVNIKP